MLIGLVIVAAIAVTGVYIMKRSRRNGL